MHAFSLLKLKRQRFYSYMGIEVLGLHTGDAVEPISAFSANVFDRK